LFTSGHKILGHPHSATQLQYLSGILTPNQYMSLNNHFPPENNLQLDICSTWP